MRGNGVRMEWEWQETALNSLECSEEEMHVNKFLVEHLPTKDVMEVEISPDSFTFQELERAAEYGIVSITTPSGKHFKFSVCIVELTADRVQGIRWNKEGRQLKVDCLHHFSGVRCLESNYDERWCQDSLVWYLSNSVLLPAFCLWEGQWLYLYLSFHFF